MFFENILEKLENGVIFSTSHRIPPIAMCAFVEAIQQVRHLGRVVDEEGNKK